MQSMCERGQEAPGAPYFPLPATEAANCATEPRLVQRHHLHSGAARVLVSGGNHGLGDAQSAGVAALEHAGRQLLCRSFG